MERVLFVDDEPRLLDGLQGLLRKRRHEWDMVFAPGGDIGKDHVDKAAFDIVVSDMRMPKVDGVALLDHVRHVRPEAVRIVLSGYSDLEATLKLVPIAHQFLSKPCDGKTLESVISRALSVKGLVPDPAMRARLGCIDRLPVAPDTLRCLQDLLRDDGVEIEPISRLIGSDVGLGAKLLQIVNSSFFGLARPCVEIDEAISYLGIDILRHLVLTSEAFGDSTQPTPWLGSLNTEAVEIGKAAATLVGGEEAKEAQLAGFLSDVGVLARTAIEPALILEDYEESHRRGVPLVEVERERRTVTHAAIGAYVLGIWGLPEAVVKAVAHHEDLEAPGAPPLVQATYAAAQAVRANPK
ncbi:MAG: HDOD domain-containing protein [Myxococcota bacterium]